MGLIEINDTYRNTIINLDWYLKRTQDERLQKVTKQHQKDLHENKSITKLAEIFRSHHEKQDKDQPVEERNTLQTQEDDSNLKHPYFHDEGASKRQC